MLESFLIPGRQDLGGELAYGQSVTDACMGWEPTVGVLERRSPASRRVSQHNSRPDIDIGSALVISASTVGSCAT